MDITTPPKLDFRWDQTGFFSKTEPTTPWRCASNGSHQPRRCSDGLTGMVSANFLGSQFQAPGIAGHRNYVEEEGKGTGHKFLRLFCDLAHGAFCRPCTTQQTDLLGQNSYSLLKATAFPWQPLAPWLSAPERQDGVGSNAGTTWTPETSGSPTHGCFKDTDVTRC